VAKKEISRSTASMARGSMPSRRPQAIT